MRIGFLTNDGHRVDTHLNESRRLRVVTLCNSREAISNYTVMLEFGHTEPRISRLKERYKIDMLFSSGEGYRFKILLRKLGITHVPCSDCERIDMLLLRLMKRLSHLPKSHPQCRAFEKTLHLRKNRCGLGFSGNQKMTLNTLARRVT